MYRELAKAFSPNPNNLALMSVAWTCQDVSGLIPFRFWQGCLLSSLHVASLRTDGGRPRTDQTNTGTDLKGCARQTHQSFLTQPPCWRFFGSRRFSRHIHSLNLTSQAIRPEPLWSMWPSTAEQGTAKFSVPV